MKVIFLAYANDPLSPLPNLTYEDNEVFGVLANSNYFHGDYIIHRESFATPESIRKNLEKYGDNIAIFHYSGHAGPQALQLNGGYAFARGLANLLQESVNSGALKLVILNGCSTYGHIPHLTEKKVPVIISTNAPVADQAAMIFSIRFWTEISSGRTDIKSAYQKASKDVELNSEAAEKRHFEIEAEDYVDNDEPNWGIYASDAKDLTINPIPVREIPKIKPIPNNKLLDTLFEGFAEAGHPLIKEMHLAQKKGARQDNSTKKFAIVNSIPFPVGIHLQKLICPIGGGEGYDSFGKKRLLQIVKLYHVTTEFLAIVMIAQCWEIYLNYPDHFRLDDELRKWFKEYIDLSERDRENYDFIPLIKAVSSQLPIYLTENPDLKEFISRQTIVNDFNVFSPLFNDACAYLHSLMRGMPGGFGDEYSLVKLCIAAEDHICNFFAPLGFLSRYHLTSVQDIMILKLRHIVKQNTEYKHKIIRCMHAIGGDEFNYYYSSSFLDNWGVMLLQCEPRERDERDLNRFTIEVKDYLNLSPFIVDKNCFDTNNTDLVDIMFYKNETPSDIYFKRVRAPENENSGYLVEKIVSSEERADAIRAQFGAFKEFISST